MMQYVMIIEVLLVCMVSSITDIRNGKIYNNVLLLGLIIGAVSAAYYYSVNSQYVLAYLINLIISLVSSFVLYKSKIWGAGDSKLWVLICILVPFALYDDNPYILYPSMFIFVFTFIFAYIYVIIDTVIQYIYKRSHRPISIRIDSIRKNQITLFLSVYFVISIFYGILDLAFNQYFFYNRLWISIFVVLFINSKVNIFTEHFKHKYCVILGAVFICIMALQLITNFKYGAFHYDLTPFVVWIVVILIRLLSSDFNYDEIRTKDAKKGLVLSKLTISNFLKSKVKGLPLYTDESTKYRISEEEAEAIKRWEDSKYGKDTIIIVRHIPFAIFLTLGVIAFLILNVGLIND